MHLHRKPAGNWGGRGRGGKGDESWVSGVLIANRESDSQESLANREITRKPCDWFLSMLEKQGYHDSLGGLERDINGLLKGQYHEMDILNV